MSQVLDLTPFRQALIPDTPFKTPNISLRVVVAMCAVGISLSLISLMLHDWVFQPSDLTALVMP